MSSNKEADVRIPDHVLGKALQALKAYCLVFSLVMPAVAMADDCRNGCTVPSRDGYFQVVATPAPERIPLREHHDWVVEVRDANGNPVRPDGLSVTGGMRGHGHGLPSQPRVAEDLGDGRYRLTGFLFNMHGDWTIRFHLARPGGQDVADLTLTLDY